MPRLFSLPSLFATLVVLGLARACWYYVYLENPYDYYYRYCSVGCAGMNQTDANFDQCCLPLTNGATAPPVCQELSDKCAAEGTVCNWGRDVPTESAPPIPSSAPSSYVPPPVSLPPAGTTDQAGAPTVSTEVVWVTSTTNTPCATTDQSAGPTTSVEEPDECVCPPPGSTSQSAAPTTSGTPPKEGDVKPDGVDIVDNAPEDRRRGFMKRTGEQCVCPTEAPSAPPATSPPPAPTQTAPPAESEPCTCPAGETSQEAAPTTSGTPPKEGNSAPDGTNIVDNAPEARRGFKKRGSEQCVCPPPPGETSQTGAPTTSPPPEPTQPPPEPTPPPQTSDQCVCPPAPSTSGTPPKEGDVKPDGVDIVDNAPEQRRGFMKRTGEECVCPPPPPNKPCVCGTPPKEGNSSPDGFSMEDNAPERRGEGAAGDCVCPPDGETGQAGASTTGIPPKEGNTPRARNTPRAQITTGRENFKRETNPVQVTTATSTSWVTTDDCLPPPTGTPPKEGATADPNAPPIEDNAPERRKRQYRRWSDF